MDCCQFTSAFIGILSFCYSFSRSLFRGQIAASRELCDGRFLFIQSEMVLALSKMEYFALGGVEEGMLGCTFRNYCQCVACIRVSAGLRYLYSRVGFLKGQMERLDVITFTILLVMINSLRNRTTAIGRARLSEVLQKDATKLEIIRSIPVIMFW